MPENTIPAFAEALAIGVDTLELDVVMTRERDEFVPLERRTSLANDADADLFLSIHANAAPNPRPRGVETFFASLDPTDEAAGELAERENQAFARTAVTPVAATDPLLAILGDLIATEHLEGSKIGRAHV